MNEIKFTYHGVLVLIRLFEENEYPWEVRIDEQEKYIGDYATAAEAETEAKWHIDHMI